jgi:flagellar basal-body rod modification protein FlgD
MIDPIESLSEDGAEAAAAAAAVGRPDSITQDEFLTLFISQLQNQDPLNPLDANAMTEQLAQFSSLEQLFSINENLEALKEAFAGEEAADPVSFLGMRVEAAGDELAVEDGEATAVLLDVPGEAVGVEVTIADADGGVVRSLELGDVPAGEFRFVFDGENASGGTVPDGVYQVTVNARTADGSVLPVPTHMEGVVTGVDLRTEPPELLLGGRRVGLADVRAVHAAAEPEDA